MYFPSVLFLDLTGKSSKQVVDIVGRIADEKESITVPVRMKVLSHSENGEHMPDLWPWLREGVGTAVCDCDVSDIKGKSLLALKITEASSARISNNGWRAASKSFFLPCL